MTRVWLRGLPAGLRLPGQDAPAAPVRPSAKPAKRKKYGNTKITNDHGTFDSRHEWERYHALWLMQRGGLISDLKHQVKFELVPGVKLAGEKRKKPALRYFADFVYRDGQGRQVIEDAKSAATRKTKEYRQKKHLMKALLNLDIVEV